MTENQQVIEQTKLDRSVAPDAEQMRLRAEHEAAASATQRLGRLRFDRGAPLGMEDHMHGGGTCGNPARWHTHPFADPKHTHEPRCADDAPWEDDE